MGLLAAIAAPLIGNLFGGLFGSHAAAPASQAQSGAVNAESALLNTIINAYNQNYAPAQQQMLGQYTGLVGNLPIQDVVQSQLATDLMPVTMPESMQARGQMAIGNQTDQAIAQLQQQLAQRGIRGPAAEALVNQLRQTGMQNQATYAADVGQWEAGQTMANQNNATNLLLNILNTGTGAANAGNALVGAGVTGANNLATMFGNAAGAAALPYQQMGANIGNAVQNYYANPNNAQAPLPAIPGNDTTGFAPWSPDAAQPQPGYNIAANPAPAAPIDTFPLFGAQPQF